MVYSKTFFVPQDTDPSNPFKVEFLITQRIITRIDIMMDTVATKGLVGIKVIAGDGKYNHFFFPSNSEEWIRKSDTWIGEHDLRVAIQPITILGCSRMFDNGIWIGAVNPHWVSVTVHTK